MTSMQSITQAVLVDIDVLFSDHTDEDARQEGIDAIIASHLPVMTTTLFQLVVNDNSLAFEEIEREADSPFSALQEAVERRLISAVGEHLRKDD